MEPRRDAGAAEVVGTMMMLAMTVAIFLLLSTAALDQARETAAYIRGMVPREEGPGGPPECAPVPEGAWCKRLPRDPGEGERCVLDERGWQWCFEVRERLPGAELPGPDLPGP